MFTKAAVYVNDVNLARQIVCDHGELLVHSLALKIGDGLPGEAPCRQGVRDGCEKYTHWSSQRFCEFWQCMAQAIKEFLRQLLLVWSVTAFMVTVRLGKDVKVSLSSVRAALSVKLVNYAILVHEFLCQLQRTGRFVMCEVVFIVKGVYDGLVEVTVDCMKRRYESLRQAYALMWWIDCCLCEWIAMLRLTSMVGQMVYMLEVMWRTIAYISWLALVMTQSIWQSQTAEVAESKVPGIIDDEFDDGTEPAATASMPVRDKEVGGQGKRNNAEENAILILQLVTSLWYGCENIIPTEKFVEIIQANFREKTEFELPEQSSEVESDIVSDSESEEKISLISECVEKAVNRVRIVVKQQQLRRPSKEGLFEEALKGCECCVSQLEDNFTMDEIYGAQREKSVNSVVRYVSDRLLDDLMPKGEKKHRKDGKARAKGKQKS